VVTARLKSLPDLYFLNPLWKGKIMKLYELDIELHKLDEAFKQYAEDNAGDMTDFPFDDYRELLKEKRADKLLGLGAWWKSIQAESKAFKDEMEVMREKKARLDRKAVNVETFLLKFLEQGEKIHNTRVELSWRKSQTLEEDKNFDINELGEGYKNEKTIVSIDKALIKKAIKIGIRFEGLALVDHERLQIK
jgi:hypothetical protein